MTATDMCGRSEEIFVGGEALSLNIPQVVPTITRRSPSRRSSLGCKKGD
jgi:hypothetical protein